MSSTVIDVAWDRPTVAQIQATGAVGVIRYFSTDPTKNLTAAEVTAYHAAGLGVGDVWETSTGRATQGYTAGVNDAQAAQAQRSADGLPTDQVVYFAVDMDTSWTSVSEYFRGCDAVMGSRPDGTKLTGVYGGRAVIDGAAAAGFHFLWQTLAWSGGVRSPHAVLYQNGSTVLGGQADINEVLAADWGQYPTPGGDMPLTDADVQKIWNHNEVNANGSGDVRVGAVMAWSDKIHAGQSAAIAAVASAVASLGTAVAGIAAAVNKLGTADAALLADLQAAQTALAGIPAQVDAALKDGTVHVDVTVAGPAPTGA